MVISTVVSPLTMMNIIERIENALWDKFETKKYQNVRRYILRWHHELYDDRGNYCGVNFPIVNQKDGDNINLSATLDTMDDDLIFRIAVDLGVEVPGLIYSVAEIKGLLAAKYENAASTFAKAHEKIYEEPSTAIIMANSALEKIIKKICADESIDSCKPKATLYELTCHILKQFNFFPDKKMDSNIKNIGSGLLNVSQAIETLRSNHTEAHGTESEIISDPLYAMLVVNSVSTIGLFLLNYYEKNYKAPKNPWDDDIPF